MLSPKVFRQMSTFNFAATYGISPFLETYGYMYVESLRKKNAYIYLVPIISSYYKFSTRLRVFFNLQHSEAFASCSVGLYWVYELFVTTCYKNNKNTWLYWKWTNVKEIKTQLITILVIVFNFFVCLFEERTILEVTWRCSCCVFLAKPRTQIDFLL